MCLLTRQIMPIKARKPIVVYKVLLRHYYYSNNEFITPWMREKTGLNRLLTANGEKAVVQSGIENVYAVSSGYIHCYTKIRDARFTKKYHIQNCAVYKTVITKCIIEQGTRYYKSWDGKEIAADSVFIREIIET